MSSSTSSSSHSQRTPLHERTNSENNKLQIRLVPYTPPKIEDEETESRAPEPTTPKSNAAFQSTKDRTGSPSTLFGRERFIGSALSSPSSSSSSSPISSSTWVKGKGVSESRLVSDLSGAEHPAPPSRAVPRTSHGSFIRHVNAPTQQLHGQRDNAPASPSTYTKSIPRRDRAISIHSDKTFSLIKSSNTRKSTGSESTAKSYSYSNTSAFSSHEETSFDAHTDDPSSLFSLFPERSVSPFSPSTSATPSKLHEDHIASSSPWNYRMIGGLRKVQKTPDSKAKGKEKEILTERLPILPETTATARSESSSPLTLKPSFIAEHSDSSSDDANYKVVGRSSPPQPDSDSIDLSSSSDSSNYQLFGQSSAPQSFASSPARRQAALDTPGSKNFIVHGTPYAASEQAVLETPGSKNFVVHSNVSPSSSVYPLPRASRSQTSYDSFGQEVSDKYSQESLVIPPLRPHKRSSSENLHLNRGSRETLHGRSNSYSSISSVLTQETGPNVVRLAHTPSASSSLRQALWAGRSTAPPKSRMDVHQWSSQLSTVLSEYEGSDCGSRITSLGSLGERASRNIQSISSSLFDNLEPTQAAPQTHSRSGSLEQPGAVFMRGARELPNPPVRTVRHHDEHGDGLADLQQVHQLQSKSSRSRLGFLSRHSSDRSSRSTSSSRTSSFTANSLPTWARVYYGSGERRWLASPPVIAEGDDSPPPSAWIPAGSPPPEQFVQNIHNPRRRPRDAQNIGPRPFSPETVQPAQPEIGNIRREPKKKTSSIWSPHLRPDNRASGYSIWRPPSATWSTENRIFGRRNIQLMLFVLGFIFPFAWMIAAFLPLPPRPQFDMQELRKSTTQYRMREDSRAELINGRVAPIDDLRYQSARWWRNLNRYMSIIGLLILGAVVALIVVGIKQGWGK
ncbi:hypothetical protein F4801DRAFT_587404 [Xylaria longipes]|nr:hypothetical protein F4801DRAFT_587404 [Xylaria longipes]RYC56482.1 hypothetical protein CHU98_g9727 [Xylaria longipes]